MQGDDVALGGGVGLGGGGRGRGVIIFWVLEEVYVDAVGVHVGCGHLGVTLAGIVLLIKGIMLVYRLGELCVSEERYEK